MNIGSSTLSDILKNSEKWFDTTNIRPSHAKRIRQAEQPYLEEMILLWMSDTKAHNLPISDEMIIEKAKMFGEQIGISRFEFKYSNGWLDKFKKRNGITSKTMSGEKASADLNNVDCQRKDLQRITA